jgi:hypothetical protein
MSRSSANHADDFLLLSLGDGELAGPQAMEVRGHLAHCAGCRSRFDSLERAGLLYLRYHEGPMKSADPTPPRPWEDLRPRLKTLDEGMDALDALEAGQPAGAAGDGTRRRTNLHALDAAPRRTGWPKWLPAAAAIFIGAFVIYRMQMAPAVNAAELLRKASAAEPVRTPAQRIRIRARGRVILRPAVLRTPAASDRDVAALFAEARYNYDDPLSARTFSDWREHLPEKHDEVQTNAAGLWEIRTTTHSSPLTEAVLTLSATDLRPLRGTMHFRDEVVEIAEADPETAPPSPPASPAVTSSNDPPSAPVPEASPSEELEVIAALHRIDADLGEPIEVTRAGATVIVTGTGLSSQREGQVRDAVGGLPRVALRFEKPTAEPMQSTETAKPAVATARRSELGSRLGEDAVDRVLDASEAMMARAFALRLLSRHFTLDVEAQLTGTGRSVLAGLRQEHAVALGARLDELQSTLLPVLPNAPPVTAPPAANWQAAAARTLTAAQRVDQLLNRLLAGGNDQPSPAELSSALRQLEAEVRVQPGRR